MAVPVSGARRALSGERVLFLVALSSTLLLASLLMLHGEADAAGPRAFRDGFSVAQGVARRAEGGDGSRAATDAPGGNNLQVAIGEDAAGGRTTTIKTQDGDEITIKHAGKKQVTTISRDEGGKITIEHGEPDADAPGDGDPGTGAVEEPASGNLGAQGGAVQRVEEEKEEEEEEEEEGEEKEGEEDAIEAKGHEEGEEEDAVAGGGDAVRDNEAVVVSGGRKVTVIQVGRGLTKVEVSPVDEEEGASSR